MTKLIQKTSVQLLCLSLLIAALGFGGLMLASDVNAAPLELSTAAATSMGTAFSYQGNLTDDGQPANGMYDFRFQLWQTTDQGLLEPVSGIIPAEGVAVVDGLFSTKIEVGPDMFKGKKRLLQVEVREDGGGLFAAVGGPTEILPAPHALYAAEAGLAAGLKDPGETIIQVGAFNMFQGGTSTNMKFAARGTGRMQVTHDGPGAQDIGFVYLPVDIPSQIMGVEQKLKTLSFCYMGASSLDIPVLAGIDSVQVRQGNKLDSDILIDRPAADGWLNKESECVNIDAPTPQKISGSVWIQFRVSVSSVPLEIGEVKLTLVSE
jgi:hypothetical protein